MKLGDAASNAVANYRKADNLPSLPARENPLLPADIDALTKDLEQYGYFTDKAEYGMVPVLDKDGHYVKSEFDVIRSRFIFDRHTNPPNKIADALKRPALAQHIAIHLTRLAAHMRQTGGDGFKFVIEDISRDLEGCSEWAVIEACREFRQSGKPFFPVTGDIIKTVNKYQGAIDEI